MAALLSDVDDACAALAPQAASAAGLDAVGFAALPLSVAQHIFALLPVDTRAPAALVCRAWRGAIDDPRVWNRLELSFANGVTCALKDDKLRATAARARGQLDTVVLSKRAENVSDHVLLEVVTANAATLHELHCVFGSEMPSRLYSVDFVEQLARAAPQLRVLRADVSASLVDALRMLRNEAPFGALRLRDLEVTHVGQGVLVADADVLALAAAVPLHASLHQLGLHSVLLRTPAVLDAIVACALSCGLQSVEFYRCGLSPASVPAIARLVRGGALASLQIKNCDEPLLDAAAAMQFADAIASSRTLQQLVLWDYLHLFHDVAVDAPVLRALAGHPSLQTLHFYSFYLRDAAAVGMLLATVVTANAPALRTLSFIDLPLGDEGTRPLLDALVENTHLQELECCQVGMSNDFVEYTFTPAVRANRGLRKLSATMESEDHDEEDLARELLLQKAEDLVAERLQK